MYLNKKKIVVTAPEKYAQKLCQLVTQNNGIAYCLSTIKTSVHTNLSSAMKIIRNIDNYPYIILPSQTAIDAFFVAYRAVNKPVNLSKTSFLAFGKDADYLELNYQITVAHTPNEPGPNGLVSYFEKQSNITKPVVIFAPEVMGVPEPNVIPNLIKKLESIGITVVKVLAYSTQAENLNNKSQSFQLLKQANSDTIIAFTSTAEIMSILHSFSTEELNQMQIACFGPYTGNNAKKLGLHPVYIGQKFASFENFIEGISKLPVILLANKNY